MKAESEYDPISILTWIFICGVFIVEVIGIAYIANNFF